MSDLIEVEPFCEWPGCAQDPAVSKDGGITWQCWEHLTDDFLPSLDRGIIGACQHCHRATTQWWVRWPEEDLAFHDHCLRPYFRELASVEASGATPIQDARRSGAYGRRRRA